jgi:hypothetical protein
MAATYNFSLGFAQRTESKAKTPDPVASDSQKKKGMLYLSTTRFSMAIAMAHQNPAQYKNWPPARNIEVLNVADPWESKEP